jgi:hypothetical protein
MRKPRIKTGEGVARGLPLPTLGIATAAAVVVIGVPAALALTHSSTKGHAAGSSAPFSLKASPSSRSIAPGHGTTYRIAIHRRKGFGGAVKLRLSSGLPAGAHAKLSPSSTRGSGSTLSVTTTSSANGGRFPLHLLATNGKTRVSLTAVLTIVVTIPRTAPFAMGGDVGDLAPGVPGPVDLSITNPKPQTLVITGLSMSIQSLEAPRATAALPCGTADFSLQQFSGFYPIVVPGSSTRKLSQLDIPVSQWPAVVLLNRPVDQDGCSGASLTLAYTGAGSFL